MNFFRALFRNIIPANRSYDQAIIVDPGAKADSGHHLAHLRTIASLLQNAADRVTLISNEKFVGDMPKNVSVRRILRRTGYESDGLKQKQHRLAVYRDISNALTSDLLTELPTIAENALVVVPGQTTASLLGISAWLRVAAAGERSDVIVQLLDNFGVEAIVKGKSNHIRIIEPVAYSAFQAAIDNLRHNLPRTQFYSGSVSRMFEYRGVTGQDAPLRPIFLSAMGGQNHACDGDIVLYLGDRKTNKGYYKLPELVERCLDRFLEERFLVQIVYASADEKDDWVYRKLNKLCERQSRFSFRAEWLSSKDYGSIVASAKAIVLPYDPSAYRYKPSGIAHEALWHDIPLVYPRDTEIEIEMTYWKGSGSAFAGVATAGMLDALEASLAQRREGKRNSSPPYRIWAQSFNSVDAFLRGEML